MSEPKPQEFGLKLVSSDKYELIGVKEPQLSDFGLKDDDTPRLFTIHQSRIILCIFVTLTNVGVLLYNKEMVINFMNEAIRQGFSSIIAAIFILLICSSFISIAGMFLSGIVFMFENYYLKNYSQAYQQYPKYKKLTEEYATKLKNAINMFEATKKSYVQDELRKKMDYWMTMDGWTFESEMCHLFRKYGYTANLTPATNDHGIDIVMTRNNKKIIVQCKQHAKAVGPHVVRDLYGTLIASKADEAILVCTSGFTSGVYNYVQDKNISLMDINDILKMAN